MTQVELIMPKMGESIMEATILTWLKKPGDKIEQDESLLEVATDKVDTEVPSTHGGILKEILAKVGDVVKVGELVDAVVLGINPAEHRISLGLKQALGDPWEEALKKYAPGSVVEGAVTSMLNFGAFVDLGNGIEGMIHISDISREKRLNHPREVLSTGQVVRAAVLELDGERRRRMPCPGNLGTCGVAAWLQDRESWPSTASLERR